MSYHTATSLARATGKSVTTISRAMARYVKRTEGFEGWGLLPPRRGEIPCAVVGSPRGHARIAPEWVLDRMMEEL